MPPDSLSARLKELRTRAGLSPRQLDRLAGLTKNHTDAIERYDRPRTSADTIRAIAAVFGASMDWLWTGEGSVPSDRQIARAVKEAMAAADARDAAKTGTEG